MALCKLCHAAIPMTGRRRPPRHCDRCKRGILVNSKQIPMFGLLACVVCRAPFGRRQLGGRRITKLTCSPACKRYLTRLRSDLGLELLPPPPLELT